ncbi:unnamed protein product [Adineta ricciae]|uniref:Diphthamide biosynthesis protein 2 n=1 Tax=Adineta ricciae TaxID=249248 RepID=A0A813MLA7_ADIRI|nr:unnamed protein product [Adineta ricciae]CAF1042376.1 unnamed protein product [Adineta ricciae]
MDKFEISACVKWIGEKNFHTVALQMPDDDLDKVHDLIEKLKSEIQIENLEFFLVGEGCSPCCNDLLNAQYCQAQGLIHFGHSCLSTTSSDQQQTIPVFYVFYQQSLPIDASTFLSTNSADDKPYCLVFYDPCFQTSVEQYSSSRYIISKINTESTTDPSCFSLYGRSVQLPVALDPTNYSIVFISHSKASLHNFALYFYAYSFHSFPSSSISSSKLLSKRMYAVECARNGSSYGLLISSNSLLNLPSTIHTLLDRIKIIFDKNDRQYYTFLMNTLSITKMNNFERNIDTYVLCSSCAESLWLSPEHKQFNIPLISLADIVHAFETSDEDLPMNYSFDLRQILSMIKPISDDTTKNEDDVSKAIVLKNPNSLLLQQRDGITRGLDNNKKWWGLQMNSESNEIQEKLPVAELKEGRTGIAAGYENEKL